MPSGGSPPSNTYPTLAFSGVRTKVLLPLSLGNPANAGRKTSQPGAPSALKRVTKSPDGMTLVGFEPARPANPSRPRPGAVSPGVGDASRPGAAVPPGHVQPLASPPPPPPLRGASLPRSVEGSRPASPSALGARCAQSPGPAGEASSPRGARLAPGSPRAGSPGGSRSASPAPRNALVGLLAAASATPTDAVVAASGLGRLGVVPLASSVVSARGGVVPPVVLSVPTFAREVVGIPPPGFVWPRFDAFALFEHRGSFRESWPFPSCSVADRATDIPPSEGKYHFVMDVYVFLQIYPYPIPLQTNHVTCVFSTWAQHRQWHTFVRSGELLGKADEFLFMLYIGQRAANEHPPTCFETIIGPPTFRTTTFEHGHPADRDFVAAKTVLWFLRGLPIVPPSHAVPVHLQKQRPSHPDREVQMVLRSSLTPAFASAHTHVWSQFTSTSSTATRPAGVVAAGYAQHRAEMVCHFAAFSAQYADVVTEAYLLSEARPKLLVAVPIGFHDGLAALVPRNAACFARAFQPGVPLLQQVRSFSDYLPCHEEPQEMHITRDAHGDIVFALPCVFPVVTACRHATELAGAFRRHSGAAWACAGALSHSQYTHTALALERCRSFSQGVPWLRTRIGAMAAPVPVESRRMGAFFRGGAASAVAEAEWDAFLAKEALLKRDIIAAFEAEDAGSGLLSSFFGNISTAADMAHELVMPPQGLPVLDAATVSMLPYPPPPPPVHTSHFAYYPAQAAPPGFPASFAYEEVLRLWGRRILPLRATGMVRGFTV